MTTPRRAELLAFIKAFKAKRGASPGYAEIMEALGLRYKRQALLLLEGLERDGEIKRLGWSIAVTGEAVAAAVPSPAEAAASAAPLEVERLRAALRFYASGESWRDGGGQRAAVFRDKGLRARQALEAGR